MPKMKIISAVIASLIVLPIWFYLLYKILITVNATELMWFLFWIYIPATFLVSIVINSLREKA